MPVAATPGSGSRPQSAHRTAQASPLGTNRTPDKQQQQQQRGRAGSIDITKSDMNGIAAAADSLPVTYAVSNNNTPQQHQQQDAADAALYRDMREALADFEAQQRKLAVAGNTAGNASSSSRSQRPARMPPRQTAFFSALRSVLQQVLAESTPAGRHTRLLAAHAWFVGHRPRPAAADPHLAAAMAASLSVSAPTGQQQQSGACSTRFQSSGRCHSPCAAGDNDSSCDDGSCFFLEQDACCSYQQQQQQDSADGGHLSSLTAAAAVGPRPSSATLRAQRLDAAAKAAFSSSWPHGSSGGCAGSSEAAEVPGLIPMGALPSSRFTCSTTSAAATAGAAAAAAGQLPGSRHVSAVSFACPEQQQQQQRASSSKAAWSAVTAQQAALEAEVASSLHGYARQWARVEEDISRRQELAAVAAATGAAAAAAAGGCAGMGCGGGRVLQHLDSQHQPSQVTAELALTAAGAAAARVLAGNGGSSSPSTAAACGYGHRASSSADCTAGSSAGVQLVVADRVKAARRQHMQEGLQECSQLQALNLGLPGDLLARALLPPPDVPYMSAFAQLPAYKPPGKVAGGTKKAKKKQGEKEKAKKGGKGSGSSGKGGQGKAVKPSRSS